MAPQEKRKPGESRNYEIGTTGVMRYSHSKMFRRRHMHVPKVQKSLNTIIKKSKVDGKKSGARMVTKEIGGAKNGGTRSVRKQKMPKSYDTEERPRKLKTLKKPHSKHVRSLRASITPGTIVILLNGRHKGKRVVFLKQLPLSGLMLVTGPEKTNKCPLKRVNQTYVIATKTKVDISSSAALTETMAKLDDQFFKDKQAKKRSRGKKLFEDQEAEKSSGRHPLQGEVDSNLSAVIRQSPEKKLLFKYLAGRFALHRNQYPHNMIF